MVPQEQKQVVTENKKAYHDYEVLSTYEAGVVLSGSEVKSIRHNQCSLKGNFVHEWHGELFVEGMHVVPYKFATMEQPNPLRKRKLLLKKKEIQKIVTTLKEKGVSCVVLELVIRHQLVKAIIGVVRGKKLHDKRATLKKKEEDRTIARALKAFSR